MNLQFPSILTLQRLLACLSIAVLCSLFSPATADATIGGLGGGDYIFIDSLDPQCDTAFTDISSTGTLLNIYYDGVRNVTLPFDFTFYGQTSPELYVKNRGAVQFGSAAYSYALYSNSSLPTSDINESAWFPYWDFLNYDSGNVYYEILGAEPNRRSIVQWHNLGHNDLPTGQTITFQLVLYENSNNFDFVYGDVVFGNSQYDAGASATIGIQGASGASYLQYSYNDNSFFNNGVTAICFFNAASLTHTTNTDQALPGDSITYTLKLENNTNIPLTNIVITDTIPTSFTVTSVISSGLSITETSIQPYTWQVGEVQPGSSLTITIVGTIDNDLTLSGTTLTNTVYITGNGILSSQPVTATVNIPLPDLSSSYKIAPLATPPNSALNYQIVITNSAIMTATDIILADPIPTNTAYIIGSVTGGTYNSNLDQIEWSGDIGPSSEMTITYAVSVTGLPPTIITNTATLIQTYLSMPLSISAKTEVAYIQSAAENFCVDFEEGTLPEFMVTETTETGTSFGRVQVGEQYAHTGDYALHLDTDGEGSLYYGGYTTQMAIMLLDMSAVTDAELRFWLYNHRDEYHAGQDGLFISDDGGATYSQIFDFSDSYYRNAYQKYSVDLGEAVASRGMTLTKDFRLKFQSYDNESISGNGYSGDGFSIDDICITTQPIEIDVQGNGVPIADGSVVANMADHTDFGETLVLVGRVEHTFTIHNTGTGVLHLSGVEIGGPHVENFKVVQQPSITELASGLTTSFRVAFTTTVAALRQAVVNIFSNDEDESPYNFNVQGRGVTPAGIDDGSTLKIESATHEFVQDFFNGPEPFNLEVKGADLANLSHAKFDILYDAGFFGIGECSSDFDVTCSTQNQGWINIQLNEADGISGDETLVSIAVYPRSSEAVGEFQITPGFLVNTDNEFINPTIENGEITIVPQPEPTETPTRAPTSTPPPTPTLLPTPTLPPGIDDGSTIRIDSYTQQIEEDLFIGGYGSFPLGVEGLNLSSLTSAKFEVIYNTGLFEPFGCEPSDGQFTLIDCEVDYEAGSIYIDVEASEGVSGNESLVFIEMLPYYDEGVGVFEIVPRLFMNEAGEIINPTIENGEIILVPLEQTETPPPTTPTVTPTVTPTATPTATPCPVATQEPFRIDPIDSPVHTITQTVTVYVGNGESVTISGESGIFTATGDFDYGDAPAQVEITLLPDQVNTFTIEALVKSVTSGGCTYGGYTLGQTLRIEHQTLDEPTDTPMPTDTVEPADTATTVPTDTPMPTDTVEPTEVATTVSTDTPIPTDTTMPTPTAVPTLVDKPTEASTEPTATLAATPIDTVTYTATVTSTVTSTVAVTATATVVATVIATVAVTDTATMTATTTATVAATVTATVTATVAVTETVTPVPTVVQTPTLAPARLVGEIKASQPVFQRDSQIRYDLSIENQGETTAENVRVEITIPDGLEVVEDQPLPWKVKESQSNARQAANSVYELSLGDLAPQSTTDDKFILLSVTDDLPSNEDVEIASPNMTIAADGDVEPFTAENVAGTNIIIEADGDTPTNLEEIEEPSMKLFLPIIER